MNHFASRLLTLPGSDRLDEYARLERQRVHPLLIDDARRGLADVAAGRTQEADASIAAVPARRAAGLRRPAGGAG